jgi:hypothetical protein
MRSGLRTVDKWLRRLGKLCADLWCLAAAVVVLFGFLVSAIWVSIWVGVEIRNLIGGGGFVVLLSAFIFGLFLAIYVWNPHVKSRVMAAVDVIRPDH